MADPTECPFRIVSGPDGAAVCGFVQRLTGADDRDCQVDLTACEVCATHSPFASPDANPVISSLIYRATENCEGEDEAASLLNAWSQKSIRAESSMHFAPASYSCDVVLDLHGCVKPIDQMLDSVLNQHRVYVVVHLLVDEVSSSIADRYADTPNVRVHCVAKEGTTAARSESILDQLTTPFVALLDATAVYDDQTLRQVIGALDERGGEMLAHRDSNCESVSIESVVVRRATLVDMILDDQETIEGLDDFAAVATAQHRLVRIDEDGPLRSGKDANRVQDRRATFCRRTNLSRLFRPESNERASCDVIVPFRDDFEYVQSSVASLLEQAGVDVVIHLVDDCSTQSSDELFRGLSEYSNIRFYRNSLNIGPFLTFNNVSRSAETEFLAVQDADDVSLPHRLARLVALLQHSGADVAGGATELFGLPELFPAVAHRVVAAEGTKRYLRESRYPCRRGAGYFLENPTLVMKRSWFEGMGGYADFGERKRNRTGVDTELQSRAYYARSHIAVSKSVLLRYRCHRQSATQHSSTGLGSGPNQESHEEFGRRLQLFALGQFDPRPFGALGVHAEVTQRVHP